MAEAATKCPACGANELWEYTGGRLEGFRCKGCGQYTTATNRIVGLHRQLSASQATSDGLQKLVEEHNAVERAERAEGARMPRQLAIEIVKRCISYIWFREGLSETPPGNLEGVTLLELVEANHIIAADSCIEETPEGKMCMMHCDDRLIAAIYAMLSYQASPLKHIDLIATNGSKGIAVLDLTNSHESDDAES